MEKQLAMLEKAEREDELRAWKERKERAELVDKHRLVGGAAGSMGNPLPSLRSPPGRARTSRRRRPQAARARRTAGAAEDNSRRGAMRCP